MHIIAIERWVRRLNIRRASIALTLKQSRSNAETCSPENVCSNSRNQHIMHWGGSAFFTGTTRLPPLMLGATLKSKLVCFEAKLACKKCSSDHQSRFTAEMNLHFPGWEGLNK